MVNVKLDCLGEIIEGDEKGAFVKILDDSESTGGYLIITSDEKTFERGYDNWVESWQGLEEYFKESNWVINWID